MNNNNYIYILILFLFSIIFIIKFIKNYEFFNNSNSDCSLNPLINSIPPDRSNILINTTDLSTNNKSILKTDITIPDAYDHDNDPLTNKLPIHLNLVTSKNIKPEIIYKPKIINKSENINKSKIKKEEVEDTRCTFDKFYKGLC